MFKFPKKQKLCGEKVIERLFANGKSISEKPFRAIWNFEKNNDQVFVKSLIVVSKKRLKLAVDRNVLKRRIKEAYRLQKKKLECFLESTNQQLNLAIIYQEEEILDYKTLEEKINLLLSRLIKEL
ncbi:MAG: ribonuclease P protein component [Bacteroidetes bacterium]|jgi:ribonuclease P protein component|nr:ribonuclease P protein component [Bacteroidota bacterium]